MRNGGHQHCLNLDSVPCGDYYCDGCDSTKRCVYPPAKCILCSKRGGLLLKAHSKQYFHPMCAAWIKELNLGTDGRRLQVGTLDKDRKSLVCSDCKQLGGAVVQCAYKECLTAFHPNCAYRNHRLMVVWNSEPAQFDLYCPEHAKLAYGRGKALPVCHTMRAISLHAWDNLTRITKEHAKREGGEQPSPP